MYTIVFSFVYVGKGCLDLDKYTLKGVCMCNSLKT